MAYEGRGPVDVERRIENVGTNFLHSSSANTLEFSLHTSYFILDT